MTEIITPEEPIEEPEETEVDKGNNTCSGCSNDLENCTCDENVEDEDEDVEDINSPSAA